MYATVVSILNVSQLHVLYPSPPQQPLSYHLSFDMYEFVYLQWYCWCCCCSYCVVISITGTSQYMYVEFVTSPAGPLLNTGFHFNVGNWPGHVETAGIKHGICDWLLSSDSLKDSSASEGIFLSIAHWYPPNTSCSYHIKGRAGEIVRLYFPR